jgi:hypothetical protein
MTNIIDLPKRKHGQCLSCFYFGYNTKTEKCFHVKHHDIKSKEFCYDWKDIKAENLD